MPKYKVGDLVFITDYPTYLDAADFTESCIGGPDPIGHLGVILEVERYQSVRLSVSVGGHYPFWYWATSLRKPTDVEILAYKLQG